MMCNYNFCSNFEKYNGITSQKQNEKKKKKRSLESFSFFQTYINLVLLRNVGYVYVLLDIKTLFS